MPPELLKNVYVRLKFILCCVLFVLLSKNDKAKNWLCPDRLLFRMNASAHFVLFHKYFWCPSETENEKHRSYVIIILGYNEYACRQVEY